MRPLHRLHLGTATNRNRQRFRLRLHASKITEHRTSGPSLTASSIAPRDCRQLGTFIRLSQKPQHLHQQQARALSSGPSAASAPSSASSSIELGTLRSLSTLETPSKSRPLSEVPQAITTSTAREPLPPSIPRDATLSKGVTLRGRSLVLRDNS